MSNCKGCSQKGLGDTVSSIIKTISRGSIKECGGCKKRKEWLNKKVPHSSIYSASRWIGSAIKNSNKGT